MTADEGDAPFDSAVQILCDEHFPFPIYRALDDAGFSITHVTETMAGEADPDIMALCVATDTVVFTNDDDFLIDPPAEAAILFLDDQEAAPGTVVRAVSNLDSWVGLDGLAGRVEHIPNGWL